MAAGYGMALKAIAGGVNGYLSGDENNDRRAQILDAYGNLPQSPDLQDEYMQGFWKQIQATPGLLNFDRQLRDQYAGADAQRGASLYAKYLPQYANANLKALGKVDPQFLQGRNQLYSTLSGDLAAGSNFTPGMQSQIEQSLRGAQAARGNILGAAPISAEAFTVGAAGENLKQQRISNMQRFLSGPSPEDKFGGLAGAGTSALSGSVANASNPGFSYIEGPHNWAGNYANLAQQQYQNNYTAAIAKANAYASAPTEVNPWMSSFQGGLNALAGSSSGGGGGGGGMGSMFGGGGGASNPYAEGLSPTSFY